MGETKPIRVPKEIHCEVKSVAASKGLGLGEYAEIILRRGLASDKRKKDAA